MQRGSMARSATTFRRLKWCGAVVGACLFVVWFAGGTRELRWAYPNVIEVSVDRGTFRLDNALPGPNAGTAGWAFFKPDSKRQYFPSALIDGSINRVSVPLWIPGAMGIALAIAGWRGERAARRVEVGACPKCGHDRKGIAAAERCPLCRRLPPRLSDKNLVQEHPGKRRAIQWTAAIIAVAFLMSWGVSRWCIFGWWSKSASGSSVFCDRGTLAFEHSGMHFIPAGGSIVVLEGLMGIKHLQKAELKTLVRLEPESNTRRLAMPVWAVSMVCGIVWTGLWFLARPTKSRDKTCRSCGYDRANLPAGSVCPECGDLRPPFTIGRST